MSLITILGPTAVGKTKLAVLLASKIGGEIISADSRQVYAGMNIGTGKDLKDFIVQNKEVPHHLIDILKAGEEYSLFQFQQDFYAAYNDIVLRKKIPILCGGTGLYLESALASNQLIWVPFNDKLRQELSSYSNQELFSYLRKLNRKQHNTTDTIERERGVRAIEIELYKKSNPIQKKSPIKKSVVFGVHMDRNELRNRIEERLINRFEEGMVEEVQGLLDKGITHEKLNYYGLEYRYISLYLKGDLVFNEMQQLLLQAIRRFSKKQMTWYRRMEKKGTTINWIESSWEESQKLSYIKNKLAVGKEI